MNIPVSGPRIRIRAFADVTVTPPTTRQKRVRKGGFPGVILAWALIAPGCGGQTDNASIHSVPSMDEIKAKAASAKSPGGQASARRGDAAKTAPAGKTAKP